MPGDDFVKDWKPTQLEISKHEGPSKHDLRFLRGWLTGTDGNNSALRGCGSDAWNADNGQEKDLNKDLVALSSKHRQRDRFERWAGDNLLGAFHRLVASRSNNNVGADVESGPTEYSDEKISMAADIVCTILAPLLTTVPMFILFFVTDITKRLGIIMAFTTLFSISLAMFSSARRIEVFAATSAFAAVQVVYGSVN
ncbi:hypothetical protein BDR22DRAFT_886751 [Usnea florida]